MPPQVTQDDRLGLRVGSAIVPRERAGSTAVQADCFSPTGPLISFKFLHGSESQSRAHSPWKIAAAGRSAAAAALRVVHDSRRATWPRSRPGGSTHAAHWPQARSHPSQLRCQALGPDVPPEPVSLVSGRPLQAAG